MNLPIPELVLLELRFTAITPINGLPHYHGAQWSALFRNIIKPYLPSDTNMSKAGICVHPVETGVLSYQKDEPVHIGLTFPAHFAPVISKALDDFNNIKGYGGHFQPGKTIVLDGAYCRVTGDPWTPDKQHPLSEEILREEIKILSTLDEFNLQFYSPLRLTRPEGHKKEGHRYCDADFFFTDDNSINPLIVLIKKIRLANPQSSFIDLSENSNNSAIAGGELTWTDISYGVETVKTIGGVLGKLKIHGKPSREVSELLVIGQYAGAGKNPAFGFGFYNIPELDQVKKVNHLSRGKTILRRAMSVHSLKNALGKLPNSSPGLDMLTVDDIKKSGDLFLESLGAGVIEGAYNQGELKKYRVPKGDKTYREIYAQNVTDKLVHKAAGECLLPVIDRLLSNSSYAYRKGLNRKGAASALKKALAEGYTSGIKADISSFFESVNVDILVSMLEGIFPSEPLVKRIETWLIDIQKTGVKGLLQGSPLSPLLSNFYLNGFDRDMEKEDFRLIRYSDDFVVLFKDDQTSDEGITKVENSLAKLGLGLKAEKTTEIKKGTAIKFLGYAVTASEILEEQKEKKDEEHEWLPVFKEEWLTGMPVYLSSLCRGAYSSGPSLVIKESDDSSENIPWNRVSRIIIVGRSQFSGGVVYRAVKEEIPVTFIDIMGRARGHLYPEYNELPGISLFQRQYSEDKEFCLSFAKEIITAKVHNQLVLLRRNSIVSNQLKYMLKKIKRAEDIDVLRGYEGTAARTYFSEFAKLVAPFEFKGRVYHPPDGPVNVMLSFGYTLLYNRLAAVLRDKGFSVRSGFFHKGRGTHAALASDLMEELRHIAERIVLSLIHLGEIKERDFNVEKRQKTDFCRLVGDGFRKYIHRFEVTMAAQFSYHGGSKMSCNSYLDEIADNLKRTLKLGIPYKPLKID